MNWPKRSTDCWNAPDEGQDTTALARSGGGGGVWIYGDAPLRKEPFGDVDSIPVLLAPDSEHTRRCIHLWRELQLLGLQFELGGESRSGWHRTPPVGISAFASRSGGSDRYRHRPRSYAAMGGSAAESSHGWRALGLRFGCRCFCWRLRFGWWLRRLLLLGAGGCGFSRGGSTAAGLGSLSSGCSMFARCNSLLCSGAAFAG